MDVELKKLIPFYKFRDVSQANLIDIFRAFPSHFVHRVFWRWLSNTIVNKKYLSYPEHFPEMQTRYQKIYTLVIP